MPFATIRSSTAASITSRFAVARIAACMACAVELAIGLRARALDGGTLGAVQQAELDAGGIRHPAHQAIQRIDLAHQVTLAEPADGRVARHLADGREAMRDKRRARAHARRRSRRLAAGMAAADHDNVEGPRHGSGVSNGRGPYAKRAAGVQDT